MLILTVDDIVPLYFICRNM